MSMKIAPTERCRLCGAGGLKSFNWQYAKEPPSDSTCNIFNWPYGKVHPPVYTSYVYEFVKKLRTGSLFKCKSCSNPWYLDENELFMNFVQKTRLELIEQWNASPITLPAEQLQILKKIGSPPQNIQERSKEYCETPCKVITKNGEVFDFAIVTQQSTPPFEEYRKYRLASDIQEIQVSPFALSLDVRIATTQASEINMGFAPTIVEKPNGQQMVFNWIEHFYDYTDCLASDIKVIKDFYYWYDSSDIYKISIYHRSTEITYFIADC